MPNKTTTAYVSNLVISSGAAILNGLTGFNSKGTAQYILLFDSATLPAEGAVPVLPIFVGATSSFSIDFGFHGRRFKNGIVVCNSSTPTTKSIGSADCWFDAQVRSGL